jgi:hypothetical protein
MCHISSSQIMAQVTAIIRLKIKNLRKVWEARNGDLSYKSTGPHWTILLDPWDLRERFLKLRKETELMDFLNEVGSFFGAVPDSRSPEHYWAWQELIRKMIADGPDTLDKEFARSTPMLPPIWRRHADVLFARTEFKHERGSIVLELTINGTLPAIIQSIYIDHLRGVRFRICARPDCQSPFPVRSKHRQKYCCQSCAHLESVRRSRRRKRRAARAGMKKRSRR